MGKLLKWLVYTLLLVLLLVGGAIVGVLFFVNPNDYKDEIAALVVEKTGRPMSIEGDIHLSLFPWLGLDLGRMTLENAPGFGEQPMAAVNRVGIRVKLLPLLERRLEVDRIQLDGLDLHLERDRSGRTNWGSLTGKGQRAEAEKTEPPKKGELPGTTLAALSLGGVDLSNARVSWDDAKSGQHLVVENLALKGGEFVPGQPVDVDLAFDWQDRVAQRSGSTRFSGQVTADPALSHLRVADLTLDLSARGADLPAERVGARARGSVEADLDAQKFLAPALALALDAEGGTLPGKRLEARLAADLALDLAAQKLSLTGVKAEALGVEAEGELSGAKILDAPAFTLRLVVPQVNPRELLGKLDRPVPETADPNVLSRASLETSGTATRDSLKLDKLRLVADDSTLTGQLAVTDFAKGAVSFALLLDAIDLDRYLPPIKEGKTPAVAPPAAAGAAGGAQLPLETLRSLALDGSLRIGRLQVRRLRSEEVELKVTARDGVVQLVPSTPRFYGGTYRGLTRIDARGAAARVSVNENLSRVQIGPLLKDLIGKDRLTGTGEMRLVANGQGRTTDELTRSLGGNGSFLFRDGAVKGFNLARAIRVAEARLRGQRPPAEEEAPQTDFTELGGTFQIQQGVLRNDDFQGKSPFLRVDGAGSVDLVRERVDYAVDAIVVKTREGQGGAALEKLKGVTIPVRIEGPFADLSYSLDLKKAVAEAEKEKLKEKVSEKLEKKLGDKLDTGTKQQIMQGLDRLFR